MTDMFTPARRSEIMARIRSGDTTPELALRRLIHRLGCRFRLHRSDLPGKPDIVLPKHRLVVFMHGCFWHGHTCKDGRRPGSNTRYWNSKLDRNMSRDKRNLRELRGLGWRCAVVWECQLENPTRLEQRLRRLLERVV
jgi:DNA mismatch endonuclease (patch repair protein)